QLNGNPVDVEQIKLQFAELELKIAKSRHDVGAAPEAEYEQAKLARDLAQVRVRRAQELVEARTKLAELELLGTYTENHPTILYLKGKIRNLESVLDKQ